MAASSTGLVPRTATNSLRYAAVRPCSPCFAAEYDGKCYNGLVPEAMFNSTLVVDYR